MTIREAAEGIVMENEELMYYIDFINDENKDDQTEFTVIGLDELEELYETFCEESKFNNDTVTYVGLAD